MALSEEMSALVPDDERVKLSSGTVVLLEPLRMRQFFRLMKIVTHGAGSAISRLRLDGQSPEEFATQMVTLVLFSIPDAEQETVEFLMAMVKPDGLIEGRTLNKYDKERNDELLSNLSNELFNPDPDDFVTIIEAIVKREAADLQALGKRLVKMFQMAQKVGEAPDLTSPAKTSSVDSPGPVTSSPTSTDGQTTKSSNSPSDESDSASQPSTSDDGTKTGTSDPL